VEAVFTLAAVLVFVAVALLVEVIWQWWFSTQSQAARRSMRRIKAMMPSEPAQSVSQSLWRQRRLSSYTRLDAGLRKLPGIAAADKWLQQTGSRWLIDQWLGTSLACSLLGLIMGALFLPGVFLSGALSLLAGALPGLWLYRRRAQRLTQLERQLPEAADLIARSLRAGHALPSTLQMIADEMPQPICDEFRAVSVEAQYGPGLSVALQHLADRIPLDDLRFFVMSILIQRDTGGNLAELMESIAALIRQRLKFFRQIRTLSAEGKLSALILFILPIVMLVLLSFTNPVYIGKLIDDPQGRLLLCFSLAMQTLGGFWMYRIIRIRV